MNIHMQTKFMFVYKYLIVMEFMIIVDAFGRLCLEYNELSTLSPDTFNGS